MLAGGCLCGAVRYEAEGTPFHETLCHCAACRKASGAPVVAWFSVQPHAFRITAGSPRRFASSPGVERSFCDTCGTTLTYQNQPGEIDVTIGSLDEPGLLPIHDHSQTAQQLPWLAFDDDHPRFLEWRPAGT